MWTHLFTTILYVTCFNPCQSHIYLDEPNIVKVVKSEAFVDKSLWISEFFKHRFLYITSPKGFGKSTNMDAVRRFCEVTVHADGTPMETTHTTKYRLFKDNKLSIYEKEKEFFDKNFGKYPVINLDFKGLDVTRFHYFFDSMRSVITAAFTEHAYLNRSQRLSSDDKSLFNKYTSWRSLGIQLTEVQIMESIYELSSLLAKHFSQDSIILIDDFDAPVHRLIQTPEEPFADKVSLIREFICITINARNVFKVLLNGRLKFIDFFTSCPDRIQYVPFLQDKDISKYYGFTQIEVENLLGKFKVQGKMTEIQSQHGGYTTANHIALYNMYDVVKFLLSVQPNEESTPSKPVPDYGVALHHFKKLSSQPIFREKLDTLLKGENVTIEYPLKYDEKDLLRLQDMVVGNTTEVSRSDADLALRYLTDHGYMTVLHWHNNEASVVTPNNHMKHELGRII